MERAFGREFGWVRAPDSGPLAEEKRPLALDSALARAALGWRPRLALQDAVAWTAAWYAAHARGEDMRAFSAAQWSTYRELAA
jgi:CDP-glucose 4,6-dehydratase